MMKAAVFATVGGAAAASAMAQTAYWDVNGASTTPTASGISASTTLDWSNDNYGNNDPTMGGNIGTWDNSTPNWNTDPTGGGAGSLVGTPGTGNVGVFSAGDPNNSYIISIPSGAAPLDGGFIVHAGGFTVNQGTVVLAGEGNGGQQHIGFGGNHGFSPSFVNVGNGGTFTVDVEAGASLLFGYRFRLPTFQGSATIVKTGGGLFNMIGDQGGGGGGAQAAGQFTGTYSVLGGTLGIGYASNQSFDALTGFVSNKISVDNNAQIRTFQNATSRTMPANWGITIGSGGGNLFAAGGVEVDGNVAITSIAAFTFSGKYSGGSQGAPVTITVDSNILADNASVSGDGTVLGGIFTFGADNSATLFPKWVVNKGQITTTNANALGYGAAPTAAPRSDFFTLNGGGLRTTVTGSIPANEGITLGANGGSLRAEPAANSTAINWTINSNITGSGGMTVYIDRTNGSTIFAGTNNYTGGTLVEGLNGRVNPFGQGALQGNTNSLQGDIDMKDNGRLIFDQTFTGTYAGNIGKTFGAGSVIKNNSGTVFFNGSNTYAGGTTVNNGALIAGGTVSLANYTTPNAVIANSGGTVGVSAGGAGQWGSTDIDTFLANAQLNNGSAIGINVDTGNSFAYSSNITPANSVGLTKLGGGTLVLGGANTYGGPTAFNGGTVSVASSGNLGSGTNTMTFNGGTLLTSSGHANSRSATLNGSGGTLANSDLANASTYSGNFSGTGSLSAAGPGTVLLSGNNNYTGGTTVNGGTLRVTPSAVPANNAVTVNNAGSEYQMGTAGNYTLGSLTINGGKAHLSAGRDKSLSMSAVPVIGAAGQLDAEDCAIIITYPGADTTHSVRDSIRNLLVNGRNAPPASAAPWNGNGGITSTYAHNTGNGFNLAVGYADNTDLAAVRASGSYTTFGGQTVASNTVLVQLTRGADATLDGVVDGQDVAIIGTHFQKPGSGQWCFGDFDYSGTCDGSDVSVLGTTFGKTSPILSPAQMTAEFGAAFTSAFEAGQTGAVPEPGSLALLGLGGIALMASRRRKRRQS